MSSAYKRPGAPVFVPLPWPKRLPTCALISHTLRVVPGINLTVVGNQQTYSNALFYTVRMIFPSRKYESDLQPRGNDCMIT